MLRRLITLALVTLALATPAAAQTQDVPANVPLTLQADQPDAANTAGYRLFLCPGTVTDCTTQVGGNLATSIRNAAGLISTPVAALARGTYTVQLAAFNADHTVKSTPLVFRAVLPPPQAPRNLRFMVIEIAADGRQTMKLLELAELRTVLQLPPLATN